MLSRPNLITVTGHGGAGKTTACTKLAAEMGWGHFYAGMAMRKLAESRGISIGELRIIAEKDKSIDLEIDAAFADLKRSDKPYIAEGRTAWYLLPNSFKVMFFIHLSIGAERVLAADKRTGESYRDLPSAIASMHARRMSDIISYRNTYGIENNEDFNHFDLVLDTSYSSPDRNVSFVRAAFSLWQKGISLPKVWLSPKSLFPTRNIAGMSDDIAQGLVKQYLAIGYDTLQPVLAVQHNDQNYILDGHHRVSAAVRAGCDFIPIMLVAEGHAALGGKPPAAFVQANVKPDDIFVWERAHGFLFAASVNVK